MPISTASRVPPSQRLLITKVHSGNFIGTTRITQFIITMLPFVAVQSVYLNDSSRSPAHTFRAVSGINSLAIGPSGRGPFSLTYSLSVDVLLRYGGELLRRQNDLGIIAIHDLEENEGLGQKESVERINATRSQRTCVLQ